MNFQHFFCKILQNFHQKPNKSILSLCFDTFDNLLFPIETDINHFTSTSPFLKHSSLCFILQFCLRHFFRDALNALTWYNFHVDSIVELYLSTSLSPSPSPPLSISFDMYKNMLWVCPGGVLIYARQNKASRAMELEVLSVLDMSVLTSNIKITTKTFKNI